MKALTLCIVGQMQWTKKSAHLVLQMRTQVLDDIAKTAYWPHPTVHECREVADKIPGAKFEVIKGDGSSHVVPIERPDDFNGLVTKFLS